MKRALAPGVLPVIPVDRRSRRPLQRQLYEGYRDAIVEGRLRPGQRLPPSRGLALELGISRLPVLAAFDQLLAEGFIVGRVGAGTFVADALPGAAFRQSAPRARTGSSAPRPVAQATSRIAALPPTQGKGPFRLSEAAFDRLPLAAWGRIAARHAKRPTWSLLAYGGPHGLGRLREVLATYLRTARGVRCEPEQIFIVSGSQQALDLCARTLLDPGDRVWIEEPGYPGAQNAFAFAGAERVPVPVDEEGLDVDAGIALAPRARLAYVTPSHQYPLGVTMTAARRLRLLEWAQRAGAWIVEDDYDSEYRYEGPPLAALQGLDRDGRVLYVGTFSKVVFPGLRLGYLVVPADLVDVVAKVRDTVDMFPAPFLQAVAADFIAEGHFGRHLRRMRQLYRERRAALTSALTTAFGPDVELIGAPAGLHLVLALPVDANDVAMAARAGEAGLWVAPLSRCFVGAPTRRGLILGFGGTAPAALREAVKRLARVVAS